MSWPPCSFCPWCLIKSICSLPSPLASCCTLYFSFLDSGKWNDCCNVVHRKCREAFVKLWTRFIKSVLSSWGLGGALFRLVNLLLFPAGQAGDQHIPSQHSETPPDLTDHMSSVHRRSALSQKRAPPSVGDIFLKTCRQQICAFSRDYLTIELSCGAVTFCGWKRLLVQLADVEGRQIHTSPHFRQLFSADSPPKMQHRSLSLSFCVCGLSMLCC